MSLRRLLTSKSRLGVPVAAANLFSNYTGAAAMGLWLPLEVYDNVRLIAKATGAFLLKCYSVVSETPIKNQQQVTVSGSVTNGNTATLSLNNAVFVTPSKNFTYNITGADTTSTVAAGLVALATADADAAACGLVFSATGAVITISYPSVSPLNQGAQIEQNEGGDGPANYLTVTTSTSVSATIVLTVSFVIPANALETDISTAGASVIAVGTQFRVDTSGSVTGLYVDIVASGSMQSTAGGGSGGTVTLTSPAATGAAPATFTVVTGGTAVTPFAANSITNGAEITNPNNAAASIFIDLVNAAQASAPGTNGTTTEIAPGDSFGIPGALTTAVSINAPNAGQTFTAWKY